MDITRFINSKDIRKHLKDIGYKFNSLEVAWLIYQCRDATIKEKHKAWQELIETMPDCRIEQRYNTAPQESLHVFLREYMALEDRLASAFYEDADDGRKCVYMDLEFYEKKLTGTQKTLVAMSRFLKGDIDAELFARAYHQIITEGYAANSMPTDFYSETLKLAGLGG